MNALAGIGSILGAIYLAARYKGLGPPTEELEDPEPVKRFSEAADIHEERALIFLTALHSAIGQAEVAVANDDCRRVHVLIQASEAALANLMAHAARLPSGLRRSELLSQADSLKKQLFHLTTFHRLRCVVSVRS
jgi:hypothetical protein